MVIVDYEWSADGDHNAIENWATDFLCHLDDSLFDKGVASKYVNIKVRHNNTDRMVGYCHGDDEEAYIELDETLIGDEDYFKETLAHELVHAKQLLKGELVDDVGFKTIWKGEEYVNLRGKLPEAVYKALPWEAEAYTRQADHSLIPNKPFFEEV
ncbi:SprT-like domain-containing protein [bacterium]|nr:SprT-like domain-containing protein [bacterium]